MMNRSEDAVEVRDMARNLIRANNAESLARAEEALAPGASRADPTGETHQLLGLAQFLQQKYGPARENLRTALAADPHNLDWQVLFDRASRNDTSRIGDGLEPTEPFDDARLAQPAALYLREPDALTPLAPAPSGLASLLGGLRNLGGSLTRGLVRFVLWFETRHGIAAAWNECFALKDGDIRRDLKLGGIRNWMNDHTLQSTYPAGQLVGNQPPAQLRPAWTERFRTANGMWTTDDPAEGAAGTRFQWQGTTPMAEVRVNRANDATLPSVREVARAFLHCEGERVRAPFLNQLTIWWIQFQLHDWLNHRQLPLSETDSFHVPLAADDPFRARYGIDEVTFRKTRPDATSAGPAELYQNEVTAWWDGSQIYGSDQRMQDLVRTDPRQPARILSGGKLFLDNGLLAVDGHGREVSGFTRNWNIGLSMFHTLFAREHNAICDVLAAAHPDWSTDQLFHTARLVNAAVMAKIHTVEWTPAVLPTRSIVVGMNANWDGLLDAMLKRFPDRKALNAFDVTNPILGGLVGGRRSNHGAPHGFTEQFAEVYRLHPGIPDALEHRPVGGDRVVETIPIDQLRERGARPCLARLGLAGVLNSFGCAHMPALINNNMPAFMNDMSVEGMPVTDLGAADSASSPRAGRAALQ